MSFDTIIIVIVGLTALPFVIHVWIDWLESRDGLSAKLAAYRKAQAAKDKAA